ncbi:MAG: DUF58 domain-containing protein [Planctomycetota bacterium]
MPFRPPWTAATPAAAAVPEESLADVLAAVRRLELAPGRLVTDVLSGGFRSSFRGGGVEFHDVREYVEGDDPRAVDWNVTARLGRPFVKRFVEERERTLVFVVDQGVGMAAGLGAWSLRQMAARVAACLCRMAIANHDRVGLLAGVSGIDRLVPPKKGPRHVLRALRDVVEAPLRPHAADLSAMLAAVGGRLRRRAVVFVLSDFAGARPIASLPSVAQRHDVVCVRLVARELHAPPHALLDVVDPRGGRSAVLDFTAAAVRAAWSARVGAWRAARQAEFARAGADSFEVLGPADAGIDAIGQPLARFFRRRSLRGVAR